MGFRDRNFSRVPLERLREIVDPRFNAAHDALSDAYYGTLQFDGQGIYIGRAADGWKHDVSHPVTLGGQDFDKDSDPTLSKALFDRVHGHIFDLLRKERLITNNNLPAQDRYPLDEIDEPILTDPEGEDARGQPTGVREHAAVNMRIAAAQAGGLYLTI